MQPSSDITIRSLSGADRRVEQLAQRDSSGTPPEPLLGAESDGHLLAAISLANGDVVADPFNRTADVVDLLRVRARQLFPPLA